MAVSSSSSMNTASNSLAAPWGVVRYSIHIGTVWVCASCARSLDGCGLGLAFRNASFPPYRCSLDHSLSIIRTFPPTLNFDPSLSCATQTLSRTYIGDADRSRRRMQPCVVRHDLCILPWRLSFATGLRVSRTRSSRLPSYTRISIHRRETLLQLKRMVYAILVGPDVFMYAMLMGAVCVTPTRVSIKPRSFSAATTGLPATLALVHACAHYISMHPHFSPTHSSPFTPFCNEQHENANKNLFRTRESILFANFI